MARGGIGMEMGMERWVFAWTLQGWDGVMAASCGHARPCQHGGDELDEYWSMGVKMGVGK